MVLHVLRCAGVFIAAQLLVFCSLAAQPAADLVGRWKGSIGTPGSPLTVVVTFRRGGDAPRGTIDIPQQGATGLKLTNVAVAGSEVTFVIDGIPGSPTFRGTLDGDRIAGSFAQGGASFPFELTRASETTTSSQTPEATESEKLDSIRAFLNGAIGRWKVPGIGVAIVSDGRVILADGFGLRDVAAKQPMTAATLMPIGSTTKSFTAFVIGTLVEQGKLDWDAPVIDYLPEFRLADDAATRAMRVRDLLTHVSGLPRHDVAWYGSSLGRNELFERLRTFEASAPVRAKWQYSNLMYMTAGVLAERVSGKSWETLVDERIVTPLGMAGATTSLAQMRASADRALGYEISEGRLEPVEYRSVEAIGPAGSINASAEAMAKWVQLQIDGGKAGGRSLIASGVLEEIHAPQVVIPWSGASPAGERELFDLYAMGWMQHAYRGRRLLEHGGNIDGFTAQAGFLPSEQLGVVVLANRGSTGLPGAAMRTIIDILLGERDYDWEAGALKGAEALDSMLEANRELADDGLRVPNTRPSHRLEDYAGEFVHPGYGAITVRRDRDDRLSVSLHGFDAKLEHYHYDIFRVAGAPGPIEGMLVEFRTATTGEIASLHAPLEPAVAPIAFVRRASVALGDTTLLDRYVGAYSVAGTLITIARRGTTLFATVPGQPEYELVPTAEAAFDLKGLAGFRVRFTPRDGRAERAILVQPNGTFAAERVR